MCVVLSLFMVNEELEVGFSPPQKEKADDIRIEMILDFVKGKGVSYPSEIGGELDISKETVYRKLRFLEGQGRIERLSLTGKRAVPDWLEPRLQGLWARGIKGDAIRRMTWYRVVKDGKSKD